MAKFTTLVFVILFSISVNAQSKKVDSVATFTTPIFSVSDLARIDSCIQTKFTVARQRDYMEIAQFIQLLVNEKSSAYNKENKPQPAKK